MSGPSYDVIGTGTIKMALGEKLERTLRARLADLDPHSIEQAVTLLGGQLVYADSRVRVGDLPCPKCGATKITKSGASPVALTAGTYPHTPSSFRCEACGAGFGTISGFVEAHKPDWTDQLELYRKIRGTTPPERHWTIARADGRAAMRTITRSAIAEVLPPDHNEAIELVKVIGYDENAALALVTDQNLPYVEVVTDRQGRPLEHWHACRPTIEEENELDAALRQRRLEVEAQIDRELQQIRRQRLAEAGF